MSKGIILETAVPVRANSSDRSEMVNQLLFGEQYDVVSENEKWVEIKSSHDQYVGWIDRKQHFPVDNTILIDRISQDEEILTHQKRGEVKVCPGSFIPGGDALNQLGFESSTQSSDKLSLIQACSLFNNAPYLWGGRTPYGIDCSGFTQLVYRMIGITLPRDASQQVDLGETVSFIAEAKEGDLAFFDNAEGTITHVGIIIGDSDKKIIHASGRVRIDSIDHNGIYNEETNSYSHQLRTIKTTS